MGTRDRILDAAASVMRDRGVAHATTKEIARVADCSEALLYKHFPSKTALLLHVLQERMPAFGAKAVPGEATVEANLEAVARSAARFYLRGFPMMASAVAQPELLAALRDALAEHGAGPGRPVDAVADYLAAEQRLGRVAATADPDAAAALLMGACFQQGFLAYFNGGADIPKTLAAMLVAAVMPGLRP
ncbi:TetR/AcrR family transcriptional regulator [Glycomyces sp. A-F 0318]|uniref:TetR/AcrR family transcriptional regulator n=1 Tax=Glycomyces amatae TaxID=2881355 RepID=UPI001E3FC7FA|nr:TetR/AcrR family transcriptional regulator [Glycomyces amatae]MCD0446617.1 TetR/AcrR family transcriptional regulator [Glycomyces amatae]